MRATRGFTLIEMMVVVVIIGILAALAVPVVRGGRKHTPEAAAWELAARLQAMRARALTEQRDIVAVLADAPGNDSRSCNLPANCTRLVLLAPRAGWTLAGYDPDAIPVVNADFLDDWSLPRGVRWHLPAAGRPALAPFAAALALDPDLTGPCGATRRCAAIRYRASGEVEPEFPAGAPRPKAGYVLPLIATEQSGEVTNDPRAVLVAFPSGIVKTFSVAP